MTLTETRQSRHGRIYWSEENPASESPRITLERFQELVRAFSSQPGVPAPVANAAQAAAWLMGVEAFRELEAKLIADGSHEKLLQEHRVLLSDIIAEGEKILGAVRKSGMTAEAVKFTVEDMEATLESLHITFRCEHGPKNSQKTNELIAQLFDVQKR